VTNGVERFFGYYVKIGISDIGDVYLAACILLVKVFGAAAGTAN